MRFKITTSAMFSLSGTGMIRSRTTCVITADMMAHRRIHI